MAEIFDVVVIGSGPAGIHAAIQAAKLGMKPVLLKKQVLSWVELGFTLEHSPRKLFERL